MKLPKHFVFTAIGIASVLILGVASVVATSGNEPDKALESVAAQSCTTNETELLGLINLERERLGVGTLEVDTSLEQSSQSKLDDMVAYKYYGHHLLDGSSSSVYARNLGVNAALSENLGLNAYTAKDDWEFFKASPSHYGSLTDAKYIRVGITAACVSFPIEAVTGPSDNSDVKGKMAEQLTVVHLAGEEPIVETPATLDEPTAGCPVTTCNDGSCSYSTGRGTCSWHGGVAY